MIIWLLFLLYPFSLHGIIIKGYTLTSPSGAIVKAIGEKHPSSEYTPPQDKVRNQVEICKEFARQQPRENTVFLVEEVSPSIAKCVEANYAWVLNDMRKIAETTGLEYKNIDLRAATTAANHVFSKFRRKEKIDKTLSFGPLPCDMKKPSFVTLDDLFAEKERYIDTIKHQFYWLDREQEKADILHKSLGDSLQGYDLSITVRDFCKKSSDEVREQVCHAMYNLNFYLFDKYAEKIVLDYAENRRYMVLLAAGFTHISNIKEELQAEYGWDHRVYSKGDGLSGYELKTMLGIATWWDYTKNVFGYV